MKNNILIGLIALLAVVFFVIGVMYNWFSVILAIMTMILAYIIKTEKR